MKSPQAAQSGSRRHLLRQRRRGRWSSSTGGTRGWQRAWRNSGTSGSAAGSSGTPDGSSLPPASFEISFRPVTALVPVGPAASFRSLRCRGRSSPTAAPPYVIVFVQFDGAARHRQLPEELRQRRRSVARRHWRALPSAIFAEAPVGDWTDFWFELEGSRDMTVASGSLTTTALAGVRVIDMTDKELRVRCENSRRHGRGRHSCRAGRRRPYANRGADRSWVRPQPVLRLRTPTSVPGPWTAGRHRGVRQAGRVGCHRRRSAEPGVLAARIGYERFAAAQPAGVDVDRAVRLRRDRMRIGRPTIWWARPWAA